MGRKNVYFRDKLEREVEMEIEIEIQKGATRAEANFSAMVNELIELGLMVRKSRRDKKKFDIEGFNRDLIRKVSGTREGMMIITALITEMYVKVTGGNMDAIEEMLNGNITAINTAEDEGERKHFLVEE